MEHDEDMYTWEKELRQAFQEAIIRGQPFTVMSIRNRIRELVSPTVLDGCSSEENSVKYIPTKLRLMQLFERERPSNWALLTTPVVDESGTPLYVWQFTPFSALESTEQLNRTKLAESKPSLLRRLMMWAGQ